MFCIFAKVSADYNEMVGKKVRPFQSIITALMFTKARSRIHFAFSPKY